MTSIKLNPERCSSECIFGTTSKFAKAKCTYSKPNVPFENNMWCCYTFCNKKNEEREKCIVESCIYFCEGKEDSSRCKYDKYQKEGLNMKSESEIKSWRAKEQERLVCLVNPTERRYCEYTIFVLNEILEED